MIYAVLFSINEIARIRKNAAIYKTMQMISAHIKGPACEAADRISLTIMEITAAPSRADVTWLSEISLL